MKIVTYDAALEVYETHEVDTMDTMGFLNLCYKHIGCDYIDRVRVKRDGLTAWVNDNGLWDADHFTVVGDYPQPLAGHIVFTGGDRSDGCSEGVSDKYTDNNYKLLKANVRKMV